MSEVLYHFTSRFHLPKIAKDGFLKLTDSNFKEDDETYKMVVWLTRGYEGEGCVLEQYGNSLNKKEIRITLKKREHYESWILWSSINRMSKKRIKLISRNNRPSDWYVSEKIIPLNSDEVIKIEDTITGKVYIDVESGINNCQIELTKPNNMPKEIFENYYRDLHLSIGDFIEFST